MSQNFFVLTKMENDIVYRLSLDNSLQTQLVELFNEQYANFKAKYVTETEIDFTKNWSESLAIEQSFIVDKFEDINGIAKSTTQPNAYEILELDDITKIKAIYTGIEKNNQIIILIQSFNRNRAITKKKFAIFKTAETFDRLKEDVIVLDTKLAGTLTVNKDNPNIGKLKFHSFAKIRQLFDMSEHYKEASEEQLQSFLNHSFFDITNSLTFEKVNTDWVKKRVGVILQDNLLQNISIEKIAEAAKRRNIEINLNNGKIALPDDKTEFKNFLKLLTEDYFDGDFSGNTYSANSKIKVHK